MGVSFPTLLLILQSVHLFNVLIANSSGLYPTFLLFIGVSGIRNMQIRQPNYFAFCVSSRLHLLCFEKAPAAEPQPRVCKPTDTASPQVKPRSAPCTVSDSRGTTIGAPARLDPQGRMNRQLHSARGSSSAILARGFPKAVLCSSGSHHEVQS